MAGAGCSSDDGGATTLTWHINPDNGGQADLAKSCTEAADGKYRISISTLPNDADGQRQQLVRRLVAKDSSIDLMSLDPVFVPELAEAGFLRPFDDDTADELTDGVLDAPAAAATWRDQLVAAPFWANTQLLWYRKSVAEKAGLDPASQPLTWDQVIQAAEQTGTTVQVQAKPYEGYMVWINALIVTSGGQVLEDPDAGVDAQPSIASAAGKNAAKIIRTLGRSSAADPQMSVAIEETAGLAQVPEDHQEAAKVDGATWWQRLWRVTLPNMKPAIMVALLFRTLDAYRIFDSIFVMTGGANDTQSVSFLTYQQVINRTDLGLGSAVSVLLFATVVLIAFVFIKLFRTDLSQVRGDR